MKKYTLPILLLAVSFSISLSGCQKQDGKSTEENPVKPWSLLSVACQDGFYIHESISMFFSEDGAKKEMTLKLGKEWKGGSTIDDNC